MRRRSPTSAIRSKKQCRLISAFLMLTRFNGLPATGRLGQQVLLERLDVGPLEVGAAGNLWVGGGQPQAEDAEIVLDVLDRVRPQADPDLIKVAGSGRDELGRRRHPRLPCR